MTMKTAYPQEKRVQRYAYVALLAAAGVGAVLALRGDGLVLGFEAPAALVFGLAGGGALVGAVAVHRRAPGLALAAAGLLVLAVLRGGALDPGFAGYGLGMLFGLLVLLYGELVHMTRRYERAHRVVDREGVPEDHINTVTDEALRTLGLRALMAFGLVALGVALAFALKAAGPRQWRAAVETTAPVGVVIASLALFGALALYVLARGGEFRFRRADKPQESASDVAE